VGWFAGFGIEIPMRVAVVSPTSRKGREKWGTHGRCAAGEQRIPPVSLRSRVGMTRGEELGCPELQGLWAAMGTFEGSTFVGMRAFRIGTILLTAMGWGEIILI
jgi:hypothetical protein